MAHTHRDVPLLSPTCLCCPKNAGGYFGTTRSPENGSNARGNFANLTFNPQARRWASEKLMAPQTDRKCLRASITTRSLACKPEENSVESTFKPVQQF